MTAWSAIWGQPYSMQYIGQDLCLYVYLHDVREGLPLSSRLQSTLRHHQVQQLHLVTTARSELEKKPLEDAISLVAQHGAEKTEARRRVLTQLP